MSSKGARIRSWSTGVAVTGRLLSWGMRDYFDMAVVRRLAHRCSFSEGHTGAVLER